MILYINGDYSKRFPFSFYELACKMWFKERDFKVLEISHAGNDESLQEDFALSLSLSKFEHDERWRSGNFFGHQYEYLDLEFEKAYVTDYREKGDYLRLVSTHQDILTVDKRAMCIMAIEVAEAIDGCISEDEKKTWLTVDEFAQHHKELLSLTYDETNELSLKEIGSIDSQNDPYWDKVDRLRADYLLKHGENPQFLEEDKRLAQKFAQLEPLELGRIYAIQLSPQKVTVAQLVHYYFDLSSEPVTTLAFFNVLFDSVEQAKIQAESLDYTQPIAILTSRETIEEMEWEYLNLIQPILFDISFKKEITEDGYYQGWSMDPHAFLNTYFGLYPWDAFPEKFMSEILIPGSPIRDDIRHIEEFSTEELLSCMYRNHPQLIQRLKEDAGK